MRRWRILQLQFYAADLPGEGCCGSALRCLERVRGVRGRDVLSGEQRKYRDLRHASCRRTDLLSGHKWDCLRFQSGLLR